MFTGIVHHKQSVSMIEEKPGLRTFTISCTQKLVEGLEKGASVSLSGACMTVVQISGTDVVFDVMQESLDKTVLGRLQVGDSINIERSFTVGQEIGGHILSGHVTGMADIANVDKTENNCTMTFRVQTEWMKYFFEKGFIAVDGCSLTIVDVDRQANTFSICFIPETLRITTFGDKREGDKVNIEIDAQTQAIVETVERVLQEKEA